MTSRSRWREEKKTSKLCMFIFHSNWKRSMMKMSFWNQWKIVNSESYISRIFVNFANSFIFTLILNDLLKLILQFIQVEFQSSLARFFLHHTPFPRLFRLLEKHFSETLIYLHLIPKILLQNTRSTKKELSQIFRNDFVSQKASKIFISHLN